MTYLFSASHSKASSAFFGYRFTAANGSLKPSERLLFLFIVFIYNKKIILIEFHCVKIKI